MTQIIAGHNLGLLFGSFGLLGRSDTTGAGTLGHGAESFANVANGNLLLQERDVFLPGVGDDFGLVRTYNSRADGSFVKGWTFSTGVTLTSHTDRLRALDQAAGGDQKGWTIFYGDGTEVEFAYDASRKLWVSTDGPGAYETLRALGDAATDAVRYVVTRADQSQYGFDADLRLRRVVDTNGVTTTFAYSGSDLARVTQDGSHVITFSYSGGRLRSVSDESLVSPLVRYGWTGDNLTSVTDRAGHVTSYHYNADGLIDRVTLPSSQVVNGQTKTYDARTVSFEYKSVRWDDHPWWGTAFDSGDAWVLTEITDAAGGVTSFDYDFQFGSAPAAGDRDIPYSRTGARFFLGATTRVVDALGNARAYSNDAEFVAWRVANGYYRTAPGPDYTPTSTLRAQIAAIRNAASVTYTVDANGQLTKVTDELGFQTVYAYDGKGNLSSVTDANGYGAVTSDGEYFRRLRAELGYRDAGGVNGRTASSLSAAEKEAILAKFTTSFTYDGNGNVLTRTDNAGGVTTWQYTSFNKVASETTAEGHVTIFQYDARQNLSRRVDGVGNIVDYVYDASGNLARRVVYLDRNSLSDPSKQQVTQYFYDAYGNNTRTIDAEGRSTSQTFDHLGNLLTSTDARGGVTNYAYDADSRLLAVTTPEGSTTTYAYDAVGNRIAITDANGHTVTQVFDRNNLLLATIDPSASAGRTRTTESRYDVLGDATSTTDAEGHVTTYAFDEHRRLVRIRTEAVPGADGGLVAYERTLSYDGTGNVVRGTDFNGNVTLTLYTTDGLVRRVTDPTGNVTEVLYNADRMQVQVTIGAQLIDAARRRVLTFGYDDDDRLASESDTLGTTRLTRYDAVGNVAALTDANGFTTEFVYDRNNRLLREIRPAVSVDGTPVRYELRHAYDENGNEVSTTDENGRTTTIAFDRDDRAVLVTDANGVQTAFQYDARGNRTRVRLGVSAHMDANRHVVIDDERAAEVTTFEYDEFNQLVAQTDGVGNALATSDAALYRQMRVALGYGAAAGTLSDAARAALRELYTDRFEYDRVGAEVRRVDHLDRINVTAYDALGRVAAVTEAQGTGVARTTTYRYDGNGNVVEATGPLGRVTRTTYDAMNRVVDETDAAGNLTRNEYDALGNLVARTRAFGTAQARTTRWSYDVRGRVVEERTPPVVARGGQQVPVLTTFAYDGEGRLVTRTTRAEGEVAESNVRVERLEYDAIGRLVAQVDGESGRTEVAYDGTGRQLRITVGAGTAAARTNAFEYDAGGRLTAEVDGTGVRTEYRYDAFGNRVEIVQAANRDGEQRHTVMTYDADNRLLSVTDPIGWARAYSDGAEFRAWRVANGFASAASGVTAAKADAILGTQRTRYEYDSLGNQVRVTDAGGTVTENTFDALGRLLTSTVGAGGPGGGLRTVNTYDAFGNVLTSTRSWGDGGDARTTAYAYDALDRQTRVTDGEGFSTLFTYDAFGNVTRVVRGAYTGADAAKQRAALGWSAATGGGYATDLAYDALDRLLSSTDGRGNVARNSWDAFGDRLTQTTGEATGTDFAHASTVTYVYDRAGRLLERHTGTDGVIQFAYDAAGNMTGQWTLQSRVGTPTGTTRTMRDGSTVTGRWSTRSFVTDGNGRTIAEVDAYGIRTEHRFDAVGNEIATVRAKGTADERTVRAEFDLDDRRVADIDALGNVTTYAYDATGHQVRRTDALGNVTRSWYDVYGRLQATLDARNFLVATTHDSAGNVLTTTVFMDALGDAGDGTTMPALPSVDAARDRVTTQVYDRASRQVRKIDPDGAVTTYAYDSTDKLLTKTMLGSSDATLLARTADRSARVQSWSYDASGRIAVFTNVDGVTETYGYDAANNRIRETLHNPNRLPGNRVDPDRVTEFEYDLDNRLTLQRFVLGGGATLLQALTYDSAGNVVSKTEAGHVSTTAYDLENRLVGVTDPLSNTTRYAYDAVGNLVRVTDALGGVFTKTYDLADRVIEERAPTVQTRRLAPDGTYAPVSVAPTTTTTYDALGNVVTVTDADGFVTTNWYDATGNRVAERNGDGAVRLYTYDATGALLTGTLDTQRRANLSDPRLPTLLGTARTVSYAYDLGGRLTVTRFSAIDVTTLQGVGTDAPTATTAHGVTPENRTEYDAFGNAVRAIDRNGNASLAWFDRRGRVVAAVDAAGFLIETDYDDQDHVVEQRRYANALSGNVGVATRPTPPAGALVKVDRVYDAAGRMIEEISGAVRTDAGGDLRVVTRFAYDGAGNLVRRTLGAATVLGDGPAQENASARTEYSFYDAANRRRAVVDAARVLTVFDYDAVGNLTSQKRYFDPIDAGVNLALKTVDEVIARTGLGVAEVAGSDERITYGYDAANRLVRQTDEAGAGTADDLVEVMSYDPAGNRSWNRNADGYETISRFDAAGNVVEVITPDGSHGYTEYDTGGLKVSEWVGGPQGAAAPIATSVGASVGAGDVAALLISWTQTGAGVSSWVAWDTVTHADPGPDGTPPSPGAGVPGSYAHASAGNSGAGPMSAGISPPAGQTVYFRIVSSDGFNLAWTAEQSITVPPRIQSESIEVSGASATLRVTFTQAVESAALRLAGGATPSGYSGTPASGPSATWTFEFTGAADDLFHLEWTLDGNTSTTEDVALLQAQGAHVGLATGWVGLPVPSDGTAVVGNGQYVLVDGVVLEDPQVMGTIDASDAELSVTRWPGPGTLPAPAQATLQFDSGLAHTGQVSYDILYGTTSAQTHDADVSFTQRQVAAGSPTVDHYETHVDSGSTVYDATWYRVDWTSDPLLTHVAVALAGAETARVGAGGMHVSARSAQDGVGGFTTTVDAARSGNDFDASLALAAGAWDLEVWYLDSSGRTVVVEWRRVTVPADLPDSTLVRVPGQDPGLATPPPQVLSVGTPHAYAGDRSLTVLASETGGQVDAQGHTLTVTPGVYNGPLDPGGAGTQLQLVQSANSHAGTKASDGRVSQTYFTQIEYNALGVKVASNEDNGLWRRIDVDANGNAVRTRLYGTQEAEDAHQSAIETFSAFDARNLVVAAFGADVDPGAGVRRAITRTTYDFAERELSIRDPGNDAAHARQLEYDGAGNLVRQVDANGNVATMAYDVFGALVRRTDAIDAFSSRVRRKVYDGAGRLVQEYTQGVTDRRYYTLDAFGRRIEVFVGNREGGASDATRYRLAYDQHDRLVSVTDDLNGTVRYWYDGRGNLTWTQDAAGHWFGAAYDGMNRATHQYSFQSRWTTSDGVDHVATSLPASLQEAKDAVASAGSPLRVALRDEATVYDPFGNKIAEVDAEGRRRSYTYGAFGRMTSSLNGDVASISTFDRFGNKTGETSNYGRNVVYTYDAAARLTVIDDLGTRTRTTYTYDDAGRRVGEALRQGDGLPLVHDTAYAYDRNGWLTQWKDADALTGIGERIVYDGVGDALSVTGLKGAATLFTHTYTFDAAGRVKTAIGDAYANDDLDATGDAFTYDARGRRLTWTHHDATGSHALAYQYDAADRLTRAGEKNPDGSYKAGALAWTYDAAGKVTNVTDGTKSTTYTYDVNNASYVSAGETTSTTSFDRSGRVVRTVTVSGDSTYTYTYAYNPDGTENSVVASGSASGSSTSTYNANRQLSRVDLGTGDSADDPTFKTFAYDNQGHVVDAVYDKADKHPERHFLYANDQPVGEYTSAAAPYLDSGSIEVTSNTVKWQTGEMTAIRDVPVVFGDGPEFPSATPTEHVVAAGETLQSIAASVYGHPELWFVIADANGLTGAEPLHAGTRLMVPNSVQFSGLASDTHAIYNEGQIVGSKLPNLKSPPPPEKDTCAVVWAIIAIVVVSIVAIVATVLTAGALGPAAFAAIAGTSAAVGSALWVTAVVVGVVVAAAVGAAIAFAASAATQGILIGFGLQESFDWKAVAADTIAGAFSGAAIGLGAIVGSIAKVTTAIRIVNVVGQTALELGGEALRQTVVNGRVDDFASLGIAGAAGFLGSIGDLAESTKKFNQAALRVRSGEKAIEETASSGVFGKIGSFFSGFLGGSKTGNSALRAAANVIAHSSDETAKTIRKTVKLASDIEKIAKVLLYSTLGMNMLVSALVPERRAQVGRTSPFQFGSAGASGFLTGLGRFGNTIARTATIVTGMPAAGTARWASGVADTARVGASGSGPASTVDVAAATRYARDQELGHGWRTTTWLDTAAAAATQIVRAFPGVPTLADALRYTRLAAGETARFDAASIVGFATGTVGHVGTNPVPMPIALANWAPPAPGA